jgi:hypothetical protein
VGRLAERNAVQQVDRPAGRQGAHHGSGKSADRPVEGGSAFDALR